MRGAKLTVSQVEKGRRLRRNETSAEHRLWTMLRNRGLEGHKFVRQLAIGPYVADFVCREHMLIIEVDGAQHAESESDARRTEALNRLGYSVLRLWNNDVLSNPEGCWTAISTVLAGKPSPGWRHSPATVIPPPSHET